MAEGPPSVGGHKPGAQPWLSEAGPAFPTSACSGTDWPSRRHRSNGGYATRAHRAVPCPRGATQHLLWDGQMPGGQRFMLNMYTAASAVLKRRQKHRKEQTATADAALPS